HGARNLISLVVASLQYDLYNRATNLNGDLLPDYFKRLLTKAIFIESVCKLYPYFTPCRDMIFEFVIFHGLDAMVVHRPDKVFRITQDLIKPRCRYLRVLQDLIILGDALEYINFRNIRGVAQKYKLNDLRLVYLHEQAAIKAMDYMMSPGHARNTQSQGKSHSSTHLQFSRLSRPTSCRPKQAFPIIRTIMPIKATSSVRDD
uniref:hypothetical protein n=1 Tax=Anaerobiospirillum succiniciproducens TaxID=13335 RepID=UPI00248E6EC6